MTLSTSTLFGDARTPGGWLDKPVSDDTLRALYDLLKWGPTAVNCSPARFVFVRSAEAKARLASCVSPNNAKRVGAAAATAIVGMDLAFYDQLPTLYPQVDARSWYVDDEALAQETAFRSSSLQGGYLIIAARALGLDAGPMSGFDSARVDAEFFAGTRVKSNFICTLGYADPAKTRPRNARLDFETACTLL